jgi:hypothetical protein
MLTRCMLPIALSSVSCCFAGQTDRLAVTRKYVLTFLRDVVMTHPQFITALAPVVNYLIMDENDNVRKQVRATLSLIELTNVYSLHKAL